MMDGRQHDEIPVDGEMPGSGWALSERSVRCVDALVEAGFDPGRVPVEFRAECRRLASLLRSLDEVHTGSDGSALVDVTLARVLRSGGGAVASGQIDLSPADDDAFEALVSAGFDAERVTSRMRARARRHAGLLSVLSVPVSGSPDERETLISKTLACVQAEIDSGDARRRVSSAGDAASVRRWSLSNLVSVAAVLLIGSAVVWPMMAAQREVGRRLSCEAGLLAAARGFGAYAGGNRDALPQATDSEAGRVWWRVGSNPEESNSANLYVLFRTGCAGPTSLACAGNEWAPERSDPNESDWKELAQVSYSFQNMFAQARPKWGQGERVAVLTDRSPVVLRAVRRQVIYPFANSPNHGESGQNVLFNDGSAEFRRTPLLDNGDNIWLPQWLEQRIYAATGSGRGSAEPLIGTEAPESADDAFMAP